MPEEFVHVQKVENLLVVPNDFSNRHEYETFLVEIEMSWYDNELDGCVSIYI